MRIALLPTGGTFGLDEEWLAGEDGISERIFSSAGNLSIDGDIVTDLQRFLRGSAGRNIDRSNISTTVSFSTSRQFAAPSAAEAWAMDYDSAFSRQGALVMQSLAGGILMDVRFLYDCTVLPPKRDIRGSTVLLEYQVTGGAISSITP